MMNAKVVDQIIHDHTAAMAAALVDKCETIEDRRLLINAISVLSERVSDSIVEEIYSAMDDITVVEK